MHQLTPTVVRKLVYSQLLLYGTLVVCIILAPASLADNSGISYFGHHHITVIPFMAGFLASDYFMLEAAKLIKAARPLLPLYQGLMTIVFGMVGIIVAPAVGNGWLDILHRLFGSIIFMTQLILAGWMVMIVRRDWQNLSIYGLQWLGGIVALIYLQPPQGFSIQGQILFQAAFTAILFRTFILSSYGRQK